MAEIFAAVASGAGLVSLAIQLLESSRKLKGLYDTAKDAPSNVKDLCFDLETLSLQLRQLEQHRQHDRLNTELLDRCIAQCQRRTDKVSDVVDDMARYIRRSAAFGRLYAAFKEPEVEKLLDQLERAKSSLSFTYISYCQGWNMRNAAAHASILQSYGNALALQHMQLGSIQNDISDGNARLYDQLEDLKDHRKASQGPQIFHEPQGHVVQHSRRRYIGTKKRNLLRFQLPLMAWLTGRTWEFAMCKSESLWTWNLHPVNYRPSDTLAFRYVQKGNIPAVEKLLLARELSIWDVTMDDDLSQVTMLQMAVRHGNFALCEHLLTRSHSLRSDEHLHAVALETAWKGKYRGNLFELLVDRFEMDVDVIDASPRVLELLRDSFYRYGEVILSHQSVDFASWPLQQRFETAMRMEYSTPLDFQCTVGLPVSNQLAQLHHTHWGNALHWAAREWYKEANTWVTCLPDGTELLNSTDHKNFILALLEKGALLHALDKRGRTPLTSMLDFNFYLEDYELWVPQQGPNEGCAVQTALWGRILSEAGVSLPEYVARENAILAARVGEDDIWLSRGRDRGVNSSRFVLSEQGILQLEATTVTEMDIWELRPPPGLFPESHGDCSTIIWPPSTCDKDRTCWQITSSRKLRSKPFIWTRSHEIDDEETSDDPYRVFKALFDAAHDDHSALALLMGRDIRRRTGESSRTRHRSSSMPPLGNAYLHHKKQHQFCLYNSSFTLPGTALVMPRLHKCLFDSRWGFHVPDDVGLHSWRACMKGCRGRVDYLSQFKEFLEYTASQPRRMASELERLGRIIEMG